MERNQTIDVAKGIGILFVVLGHLPTIFGGGLYQFHMALFFLLSGLCFKAQHVDHVIKFIYKRFVQLIVPVYFFIGVAFIIKHTILDKTTVNGFIDQYHLFGTFWFLKDLFKCNVITILLLWVCRKLNIKNLIYSLGFIFAVAFVSDAFGHHYIANSFFIELFYFIGFYLKEKNINLEYSGHITINSLVYSGLTISVVLFIPPIMPKVIADVTYPLYIPYLIMALSASWVCLKLSSYITTHKTLTELLTLIGRNTMPIVLLQWPAFCVIDLLIIYILKDSSLNENIVLIIKFISGVTLPLLAYSIYKFLRINILYKKIFRL